MAKRPIAKKTVAQSRKKAKFASLARKKKAKIPPLGGSLAGLGGTGAQGLMP